MPTEGEEHRRIREQITGDVLRHLKDCGKESAYIVKTAHQKGHGAIALYAGKRANERGMSDADVVILGPDRKVACIVEVKDRDVTPKNVIGIIGATALCDRAVHKDEGERLFGDPALFIVVNSSVVDRPSPVKKNQLKFINDRFVKGTGTLKSVTICSESEFAGCFDL